MSTVSAPRLVAPLEILRLLRPHQWVKNGFVAAPLFFTPSVVGTESALRVALGVLVFCFLSSSVYILYDYRDREGDRQHPDKRRRPLAAGTVPVPLALGLMATLLVGSLIGAYLLEPRFAVIAFSYVALNAAYSLGLKHVSIVDVMIIAAGFVFRIEGGSTLIEVQNSVWIILCTGMLALFIAIAKRRDDVVKKIGADHRKSLNGYTRRYLDIGLAVVLSAVLMTYMMYVTDEAVMARLQTDRLYLTLPFVVAGVLRYLQITFVEERSGSPTTLALTDRFLVATVLGWLLTFAALIYL